MQKLLRDELKLRNVGWTESHQVDRKLSTINSNMEFQSNDGVVGAFTSDDSVWTGAMRAPAKSLLIPLPHCIQPQDLLRHPTAEAFWPAPIESRAFPATRSHGPEFRPQRPPSKGISSSSCGVSFWWCEENVPMAPKPSPQCKKGRSCRRPK